MFEFNGCDSKSKCQSLHTRSSLINRTKKRRTRRRKEEKNTLKQILHTLAVSRNGKLLEEAGTRLPLHSKKIIEYTCMMEKKDTSL